MPKRYAPNEFYADRFSYRLIKARRRVDKVISWGMLALLALNWFAVFYRRDETDDLAQAYVKNIADWYFTGNHSRDLLIGVVAFGVLLNIGPSILFYARKLWLYPKSSMHLQAYVPVTFKETVKMPRASNANASPRTWYVHVVHPVSGQAVPVEVSEDWYMHLEAGHQVHAHYHPSNEQVMYLVNN